MRVKKVVPINEIILDCVLSDKMKWVLCAYNPMCDRIAHIIYNDTETMDNECHEFIEKELMNYGDDLISVTTDCSVGYLPKIIKLISDKGVKQIFGNRNDAKARVIEIKMIQLLKSL